MVTLPSSSAVVPRRKRDVDVERLVEQPFLAVDRHQFDEILAGAGGSAARRRWRGSTKVCRPVLVIKPGRPAGHLAHELREHALRQRVGLDLVGESELRKAWRVDQRAGDAAPQHAFVPEMPGPFADCGPRSRRHG